MMPVLWTSEDAAAATRGRNSRPWRASGVSIDSRTLAEDDLFVALRGPRFDGHDYVADALRKGAAAALVDSAPSGLAAEAPLLVVDETLKGLESLAAAARQRSPARIAAVTGSVGKTGIKEALRLVLGRQAETAASVGNLNNQWGAPLSLARLPRTARYGIFELGMNHSGEIEPLSRLVRPHVALVTTIAPAHTEFFDTIEAVADAKAEIFSGLEPDGTAVLNRDNRWFDRLAAAARSAGAARVVSFGSEAGATVRLTGVESGEDGSVVSADCDGRPLTFRVGAPGRHWVANSLAVLATVAALGASAEDAAAALADVRPPQGRGRRSVLRVPGGNRGDTFTLIDESYNASPEAVRAAFEVLALASPSGQGRRIAVLGDMRELGAEARSLHVDLTGDLVRHPIDLVYAAGPLMAELYRALPPKMRGGHAADSAALAPLIAAVVRPGDVVLVKGSLGMGMARIVTALSADGEETGQGG